MIIWYYYGVRDRKKQSNPNLQRWQIERERYRYKKNFQNKKTPYWDFNRVVLSGWLIRYPGKFFAVVKFPLYLLLGIIAVLIYNAGS